MGDAFGVAGELLAVGLVHERVEVLVDLQEIGRHVERIVQIGERLAGMRRPCVQHTLRGSFNRLPRSVAHGRPNEVVVNEIL